VVHRYALLCKRSLELQRSCRPRSPCLGRHSSLAAAGRGRGAARTQTDTSSQPLIGQPKVGPQQTSSYAYDTMTLKQALKRSSLMVNAVHAFRSVKHKWQAGGFGWVRTDNEIVEQLNTFSPASGGSLHARAGVALQSAQQTFPLLCSVIETVSKSLLAPRPIEDIFSSQANNNDTIQLASLFDQYGSDKSNHHNYHLLYGGLLGPKRSSQLRILEIGLGTNNPDILSNMGPGGKPGASLRAFRDFCPNAQLFGADIDHRRLFEEEKAGLGVNDWRQRSNISYRRWPTMVGGYMSQCEGTRADSVRFHA
jgi:hypothetical protein